MMPVAGILVTKFDPSVVMAVGFALTSFGLFHVTNLHLGISFNTIVADRIIQVIGIPLIFIPISTLNYVGVPQSKFNQVSGISNFTRNLGGAIGISMLGTFISSQQQVHRTSLAAHTNHANPFFECQLNAVTHNLVAMGVSASDASHRALLSSRLRWICRQAYWIRKLVLGAWSSCVVPHTTAVRDETA